MTLTFKLLQDIIKGNAPDKFKVCHLNMRAQTDGHTDRTNFISSTADAGWNEKATQTPTQQ